MKFATFAKALAWAKTYAREWCLPCHFWRVEREGGEFVVAVRWRSTGALCAVCR